MLGKQKTASLYQGVTTANLELVQKAIEQEKCDVNADITQGSLGALSDWTPTIWKGVLGKSQDNLGYRAIHWAARVGAVDIVAYLYSVGAELDITNAVGNTALHVAIYYGKIEAALKLIELGANVNYRNTGSAVLRVHENLTPLHYAIIYCPDLSVLKAILKSRGNPALKAQYNLTSLHIAVRFGNLEAVEILFDNSTSNDIDNEGNSALHHAVERIVDEADETSLSILQFLLENRVNPNVKNHANRQPIAHLVYQLGQSSRELSQLHLQAAHQLLNAYANRDGFDKMIESMQYWGFALELIHYLVASFREQLKLDESLVTSKKSLDAPDTVPTARTDATSHDDSSDELQASQSASEAQVAAPPPPPALPNRPLTRSNYQIKIQRRPDVAPKNTETRGAHDLVSILMDRMKERRVAIESSSDEETRNDLFSQSASNS